MKTQSPGGTLLLAAALVLLTACAAESSTTSDEMAATQTRCRALDTTGSSIVKHDCSNKDHVDNLNGQAVLDSVNAHYVPAMTPGAH
jgi:uncharacterized lipoprotein YajG